MRVDCFKLALRCPEAQPFVDLNVVLSDFRIAREMLLNVDPQKPWAAQEAHWSTSVVRYGRPFKEGRIRWRRADFLERLPAALIEVHNYVIDVRDGYIAHPVGKMDDFAAGVQVARDDMGNVEVRNVVCDHERILSPGSRESQRFSALIAAAIQIAGDMIEIERAQLLALVKRVPIETLLARGELELRTDASAPKARRKQGRSLAE